MLANNLIQVAGVIDHQEALLLRTCGVKYLGFPLRLPVNKEDLSEEEASRIIRSLESPHYGVVITYLNKFDKILEFCKVLGARIVQLHGDIDVEQLEKVKQLDPELTIIKSLVVGLHKNEDFESMIEELSPYVDAYITDTFDPTTGASGATGKTHDWGVSRRFVELSDRPVILAGGLTPNNVKSAVVAVGPAGVDVHTGVEDTSGRKSLEKVKKFVEEAEAGFQLLKERAV